MPHLVMALTKVKRRSGMMTRATFLLNKERKVCFSACHPRWVSSIWLRTLWTSQTALSRCVARNPKEMVRQVAAARELDSIEVKMNVKEFPSVAPLPRKEANFLPIGILARRPCPSTSRTRRSSSASRTTSRTRGGPLLLASPR